MLDQNEGPFWVALWPCLSTFDILRIRATAKEFNDAKNYAELFLFLLRNMRCETDPIEPGHVGIESLIFTFPLPNRKVCVSSPEMTL